MCNSFYFTIELLSKKPKLIQAMSSTALFPKEEDGDHSEVEEKVGKSVRIQGDRSGDWETETEDGAKGGGGSDEEENSSEEDRKKRKKRKKSRKKRIRAAKKKREKHKKDGKRPWFAYF